EDAQVLVEHVEVEVRPGGRGHEVESQRVGRGEVDPKDVLDAVAPDREVADLGELRRPRYRSGDGERLVGGDGVVGFDLVDRPRRRGCVPWNRGGRGKDVQDVGAARKRHVELATGSQEPGGPELHVVEVDGKVLGNLGLGAGGTQRREVVVGVGAGTRHPDVAYARALGHELTAHEVVVRAL